MSLFTVFKNNPPMESLKLLVTAESEAEMNIIRDILESSEIPVFVRYRDSSSAAKLYAGYSIFGADVFVDESDFEKAEEILAAFRSDAGEENEEEISDDELAREALSSPPPAEEKSGSLGLLLPVAAVLVVLGLVGLFLISRL